MVAQAQPQPSGAAPAGPAEEAAAEKKRSDPLLEGYNRLLESVRQAEQVEQAERECEQAAGPSWQGIQQHADSTASASSSSSSSSSSSTALSLPVPQQRAQPAVAAASAVITPAAGGDLEHSIEQQQRPAESTGGVVAGRGRLESSGSSTLEHSGLDLAGQPAAMAAAAQPAEEAAFVAAGSVAGPMPLEEAASASATSAAAAQQAQRSAVAAEGGGSGGAMQQREELPARVVSWVRLLAFSFGVALKVASWLTNCWRCGAN